MMRIASKMKLVIKHGKTETEVKPLELDPKNPGFGKPVNYRDIDPKDPQVEQQLRIYRKHGKIKFDEILLCDKNGVDELKPSPVKRMVAGKKKPDAPKGDRATKRKKDPTWGGVKDAEGSKKAEAKTSKTGK